MKIAQLVCAYPPYRGGMGEVAESFHRALAAAGHESAVICPDYGQPKAGSDKAVRRYRPFLKLGNAAFLPQLAWRLRAFDLVHLHYPFFGGLEPLWLAKSVLGQRFTLAIHFHMRAGFDRWPLKLMSRPSAWLEPSLWKQARGISCASLDYAQAVDGHKGLFARHRQKYRELPFSVDTEFFEPEPGRTNGGLRLIFVGALDRAHFFKGVPILLRALQAVKRGDWRLEVVGAGDLRPEYESLAAKLGLGGQVRFSGRLSPDGLKAAYQRSDVLVLPSSGVNEAFGLVLLEAMACGLAVIASRLPGVRTVFSDGQEGLYFAAGDSQELSGKISALIADKPLLAAMQGRSRRLALDKYGRRAAASRLVEFYESLLDKQSL